MAYFSSHTHARKPNATARRRIVVVEYDPAWPRLFDELRAHIWPAVSHAALAVEHVGSTAVPGLAAKPVIDISIVVPSREELPLVVAGLASLGYVHRGNLGVEDREAFDAPAGLTHHHLYACPAGGIGLQNQLAVRDYLRSHADAAREYAALKRRLAETFPHDIGRYVAGKTDFVLGVLRASGVAPDRLLAIERANRAEETSWRKTFRDAGALAGHIEALRAFGESRAVAVLGTDEHAHAVLLERVTPGATLASTATEDEAMRVVVDLFKDGWPPVPADTLAEPLADFALSLVRAGRVDEQFARPAALLAKLLEDPVPQVLLHGDLHYANVLSSERAGYVLIDPKGVAGDAAFDIGYLVSRPAPVARDRLSLRQAIDRRLAFLPDAIGLTRQRVAAFAYVAAALSAAWSLEDQDPDQDIYAEAMRILAGCV